MNTVKKIEVSYFTDILCIWAYLAQIRIDELKATFGPNIVLQQHFIPVFGSVAAKMESVWGAKGGSPAYNKHVHEIATQYDHIKLHPDIWMKNTPTTSISCHLFLKAIQLLEMRGELSHIDASAHENSVFEDAIWAFRVAFFRDLRDVSDFREQMKIAEALKLPRQKIEQLMHSGIAFAALDNDFQLKEKYGVSGSPTLILNEGRQVIYGNVGYRVIEANIHELLHQPENQVSWC